MAEGLLGGVLGGDDEKREAEASEARAGVETTAGAEAFAAAIAARLSGNDPGVARKTEIFLDEQAQLLATQRQHLHDEHAVRLAHLTHQRHLLLGQRLGQAIRLAFQVIVALVVLVIGIGIAITLHDAFTSHSVVINAFDAPAALAARGVTGTVVAGDVLDELTRLQDITRTSIPNLRRNLSNSWSNPVKVDVPETGISLGEVSRLLRARFGHDLHIGGELVETASGGLAVTVRGDNLVPKTFTGSADDYHKIVVSAAQYLYAEFQPYLWAVYLAESGRCPDSIAFVKSAYARVDDQRRASFLNVWGNCAAQIDPSAVGERKALELDQEAIKLRPDFWSAYHNEQVYLAHLGAEEGAWRVGEALRRSAGARLSATSHALLPWDGLTGDLQSDLEGLFATAAATGGMGSSLSVNSIAPEIATDEVLLHDPATSALTLQTAQASDLNPVSPAEVVLVRGLLAAEAGDVAQAATELDAAEAAVSGSGAVSFRTRNANLLCQLAVAEDAAGHPDKADAVIASGSHYVDCQRFRGDILDHRGDWAGAQQAYAQAVALAPDLPAGYYSWGVALARHGDLAGALAKLQAANQRGPHWADPLKAWGDVLAKQGHWKDALAKYGEALRYAPNWAALKQARAAAAAKTRA